MKQPVDFFASITRIARRLGIVVRIWFLAFSVAIRNKNAIILLGVAKHEKRLIEIIERGHTALPVPLHRVDTLGKDFYVRLLSRAFKRNKESVAVAAWGYRDRGILTDLKEAGFATQRYEDGFVRSIGPHQSNRQGNSIIKDSKDLYFCYDRETELEGLISKTDLSCDADRSFMASEALSFFLSRGVSKYGVAPAKESELPFPADFVLVIGQLERDQSIQMGSPKIKTNSDLARIARSENPDAYLVYKPHPEVAYMPELQDSHISLVAPHVDLVLEDKTVSLTTILKARPKMYVITSGAGFEGLLYGCAVRTVGGPFYAGWGLTSDLLPFPRRGQKKTVLELFCAAYLTYTKYCDLTHNKQVSLNTLVERLMREKETAQSP